MYMLVGFVMVAVLTVFVAWLLERRKERKQKTSADAKNDIAGLNDYNFTYRNIKDD